MARTFTSLIGLIIVVSSAVRGSRWGVYRCSQWRCCCHYGRQINSEAFSTMNIDLEGVLGLKFRMEVEESRKYDFYSERSMFKAKGFGQDSMLVFRYQFRHREGQNEEIREL